MRRPPAGAYSLFYFIGTLGAVQVPVVNTTPLRSLEQMGPLLVFVGFQARNSFGAILGAIRCKSLTATASLSRLSLIHI